MNKNKKKDKIEGNEIKEGENMKRKKESGINLPTWSYEADETTERIDWSSRTVRTMAATAQKAPSQKIMARAILRFDCMLRREMTGSGRHSTRMSSVKLLAEMASFESAGVSDRS